MLGGVLGPNSAPHVANVRDRRVVTYRLDMRIFGEGECRLRVAAKLASKATQATPSLPSAILRSVTLNRNREQRWRERLI